MWKVYTTYHRIGTWNNKLVNGAFIHSTVKRATNVISIYDIWWIDWSSYSRGSAQLQVLLDEWTQCSGQWQKSTLFERMTAKKSCRKHGARVWLTRSQIATKYGDQKVADEICDGKLLDESLKETHTKPHPDAPNSKARFVDINYISQKHTYDMYSSCWMWQSFSNQNCRVFLTRLLFQSWSNWPWSKNTRYQMLKYPL